MKFYLMGDDSIVPERASDLARIYTEIVDDNVVLTSARNNRSEDYYELAKVEYTNGCQILGLLLRTKTVI